MTPSETPTRIVIIGGKGGGGHAAQVVLNLARAGRPYTFEGYLNDRLAPGAALYGGSVLGKLDDWPTLDEDVRFLAPLHKVGHMQQNCTRLIDLGIPDSRWATLIDPMATVAENSSLGPGSYVVGFAGISIDSTVGAHCTLRANARVGNDVTVGDFVFVGVNSVLCTGSRVESGAHLAPGALVGNDVQVGRFAVVGLGAVVTRDVPNYAVVVGNPARVLKTIEPIDVPSWSFHP
jgi:sugar O-acyltransferase (sialic acid O-acetyltransferase NeuD family)